jgi:hypothetical protein
LEKELRGLVAIGMLECWNNGKMGSAKWSDVLSVEFSLGKETQLGYHHFESQPSNIPPFHYSMIE